MESLDVVTKYGVHLALVTGWPSPCYTKTKQIIALAEQQSLIDYSRKSIEAAFRRKADQSSSHTPVARSSSDYTPCISMPK
jgi:hypothetical protein